MNENDVVTQRVLPLIDDKNQVGWDNDSLAALVASTMGVDVLINITDSPGVYSMNAKTKQMELLDSYAGEEVLELATASRVGSVGAKDKLDSLLWAVKNGVKNAIVMDSSETMGILKVLNGQRIGTLFSTRMQSRL